MKNRTLVYIDGVGSSDEKVCRRDCFWCGVVAWCLLSRRASTLQETPKRKLVSPARATSRQAKPLLIKTEFDRTRATLPHQVSKLRGLPLKILRHVWGPFRTPTLQSATSRLWYTDNLPRLETTKPQATKLSATRVEGSMATLRANRLATNPTNARCRHDASGCQSH